tara:strand:- start:412 stop:582 length:171 start_codon:yes stop_codon:yes gene_type:complete
MQSGIQINVFDKVEISESDKKILGMYKRRYELDIGEKMSWKDYMHHVTKLIEWGYK